MINQQGVQTVVMLNQMKENNEVNIVNILFSSKKSNFLTNPSKKELAMAFFFVQFCYASKYWKELHTAIGSYMAEERLRPSSTHLVDYNNYLPLEFACILATRGETRLLWRNVCKN